MIRLRLATHLFLGIALPVMSAGCSPANQAIQPTPPTQAVTKNSAIEGEAVVFAASSLKESFEAMSAKLEGVKADFSFAGSQALVSQLSQGAKADVFASADAKNMDAAIEAGSVVSGTQRILATNRLVVVVPSASSNIDTLKELAMPGIKLVLADKSVPAGNYSLQVLDKLSADPAFGSDFRDKALANVVSYENNVRQVLSKVELGEADAGIVYTTDARSAKVGTVNIPETRNVLARYYIAPVKDARHPQAAQSFIEYTLSEEGQKTLESHGFGRADQGR